MTDNPYLRRKARNAIGQSGRASEKRLARRLGGKGRPASGALPGAKGDIELETVLLEAKSTTGKSMSLQRDWLLKIAHEARSEHKTPALSISFVTPDGNPILDGQWVAVPMSVWQDRIR